MLECVIITGSYEGGGNMLELIITYVVGYAIIVVVTILWWLALVWMRP